MAAITIFTSPTFELHWDYTYEMIETTILQNPLKFKGTKEEIKRTIH